MFGFNSNRWVFLGALLCIIASTTMSLVGAEDGDSLKKEAIHAVLEETEVLKMLRDQASQQDHKIEELHNRLERELHIMQEHFEEMFDKIHSTEENLEKNLARIEEKVFGHVQDINKKALETQGSWKTPFFFLIVLLVVLAGVGTKMYQKATRHTHYL